MKTGTANLPLHGGSAPPWLFKRMRLLAGEIVEALVYEHGQEGSSAEYQIPIGFKPSHVFWDLTGTLREQLRSPLVP